MAALKMGNGLDEEVAVGPLVNAEARDKVHALVLDARAKGAKLLTGGERLNGIGYFYPATVLMDVSPDADLVSDEIFGPVAAIQTRSEEHTSELQSLMRISYAVLCLTKKKQRRINYKSLTNYTNV